MDYSYRYSVMGPWLAEKGFGSAIAPDLRGRGRSLSTGRGDSDHGVEEYVATLRALVSALAPWKEMELVIVGHSMGGAVAAHLAASYRSAPGISPRVTVSELVLMSPAGMMSPSLFRFARSLDACCGCLGCVRPLLHAALSSDQESVFKQDFCDASSPWCEW